VTRPQIVKSLTVTLDSVSVPCVRLYSHLETPSAGAVTPRIVFDNLSKMFRKGFQIVSRQWRYKSKIASMRDSRDTFKTRQPTRAIDRSNRDTRSSLVKQDAETTYKQTLDLKKWYKWDMTLWSSFPVTMLVIMVTMPVNKLTYGA
jgi:hypothetical protein